MRDDFYESRETLVDNAPKLLELDRHDWCFQMSVDEEEVEEARKLQ
jgi:hypothetical protein